MAPRSLVLFSVLILMSSTNLSSATEQRSAFQLVRKDSGGQLVLLPEGLSALRALRGKVNPVALLGKTTTGKSFLLNQMGATFAIDNSQESCTKGLWMSPLEGGLLALDTEGSDGHDTDLTFNAHVQALALMLSSLVVVNVKGKLGDEALSDLRTAVYFSSKVRKAARGAGSDSFESRAPFLVFLLRDYDLKLTKHRSLREHLEVDFFEAPAASDSDAEASKLETRRIVREAFPDWDVVALPHPGENITRESPQLGDLSPKFQKGVRDFIDFVRGKAGHRNSGGDYVDGAMLESLLQSYVAAINAGASPEYVTAWQAIAERECQAAGAEAKAAVASELARAKGLLAEEARGVGRSAVDEALGEFDARTAHVAGEALRVRAQLERELEALLKEMLLSAGTEAFEAEYKKAFRPAIKSTVEEVLSLHESAKGKAAECFEEWVDPCEEWGEEVDGAREGLARRVNGIAAVHVIEAAKWEALREYSDVFKAFGGEGDEAHSLARGRALARLKESLMGLEGIHWSPEKSYSRASEELENLMRVKIKVVQRDYSPKECYFREREYNMVNPGGIIVVVGAGLGAAVGGPLGAAVGAVFGALLGL